LDTSLEQSADGPQTARLVAQPYKTVTENTFLRGQWDHSPV